MNNTKKKLIKTKKPRKKTNPKKLLLTFGQKGLWFNDKTEKKVKHYNVSTPDDYLIKGWWHGILEFFKQKKKISATLRNVDEVVILSKILSGFFAGFIFLFIDYAKSKDKKVVLITSENLLNDINLEKYLSGYAEIINIMDREEYQKKFKSQISLWELETCLNTLYIQELEHCLTD